MYQSHNCFCVSLELGSYDCFVFELWKLQMSILCLLVVDLPVAI
jgi:hypothetical protein